MSRLFVTYPAGPDAQFDRDYYVATHLPLVERHWFPLGLTSARAFFLAGDDASEIAIAVLTFENDDAIGRALAAPSTPEVMADVPNFTNTSPAISRGTAL